MKGVGIRGLRPPTLLILNVPNCGINCNTWGVFNIRGGGLVLMIIGGGDEGCLRHHYFPSGLSTE